MGQHPTDNIFALVHDLGELKDKSYQWALERWFKVIVKENGRRSASVVFPIKKLDLYSRDDSEPSFTDKREKLKQDVFNLINKNDQYRRPKNKEDGPKRRPNIYFLACGFGCQIVEDMLCQPWTASVEAQIRGILCINIRSAGPEYQWTKRKQERLRAIEQRAQSIDNTFSTKQAYWVPKPTTCTWQKEDDQNASLSGLLSTFLRGHKVPDQVKNSFWELMKQPGWEPDNEQSVSGTAAVNEPTAHRVTALILDGPADELSSQAPYGEGEAKSRDHVLGENVDCDENNKKIVEYSNILNDGIREEELGNYVEALAKCKDALRGFEVRLGTDHPKSLKAAGLVARLLALTSRVKEAEAVCYQTLERGPRLMGLDDSQTLGVMMTLLSVLRMRWRLVEAMHTGKSLCETMAEAMGDRHAQTLECRAELANCYRLAGFYKDAEAELSDVVLKADRSSEDCKYLARQAELAQAYLSSGKFRQAKEIGLRTLRKQHKSFCIDKNDKNSRVFINSSEKNSGTPSERDGLLDSIIDDINYEYDIQKLVSLAKQKLSTKRNSNGRSDHNPEMDSSIELRDSSIELETLKDECIDYIRYHSHMSRERRKNTAKGVEHIWDISVKTPQHAVAEIRETFPRLRVHPSLLQTLDILARIELQANDGAARRACRLLETLARWRSLKLGKSHELVMTTQFLLADANRSDGHMAKSRDMFRDVYARRLRHLGKSHPDTLLAKLEFVIANTRLNTWEDPDSEKFVGVDEDPSDMQDQGHADISETVPREITYEDRANVELSLRNIASTQGLCLGPSHPDTLKTHLWILTFQVGLGKTQEAAGTRDTLMEHLRRPEITEQRQTEVEQLTKRIEWLFR